MTDIYTKTRDQISTWMDGVIKGLPDKARLAVFGTTPYARYLAQLLQQAGVMCVAFLSSTAPESTVDDLPVILPKELVQHDINCVISGSMAAPEGQASVIRDISRSIDFHAIPDGAALCTEPRFNPCDKKKLDQLKASLTGKQVCIIGNGPSLNLTPPEALGGLTKLAGNGILLRKGFVPDYYFILDHEAIDLWGKRIHQLHVPQILPSHLYEILGHSAFHYYYPACYHPAYSEMNPYYFGVPTGGTIIVTMIYFAVFMGASGIILIGVDNNYVDNSKTPHFSGQYYDSFHKALFRPFLSGQNAIKMAEKHKAGILKAVAYAESYGVKVLDATGVKNNLGLKKIGFHRLMRESGANRRHE